MVKNKFVKKYLIENVGNTYLFIQQRRSYFVYAVNLTRTKVTMAFIFIVERRFINFLSGQLWRTE